MKIHAALIMVMALGIAAAPIVLAVGAAQAGADSQIVFQVA